jgi:hypothetical protein
VSRFRAGISTLFSRSIARASRRRVVRGVITLVDVAALGGDERGQKAVLVFLRAGGDLPGSPISARKMISTAPLSSHHGDLRRRPGIVDVAADVLRRHHAIGAAEMPCG